MSGVSASRTLPTIWVHMCSVAYVCRQASNGNAGQVSFVSVVFFIGLLCNVNLSDRARRIRLEVFHGKHCSTLQTSLRYAKLPTSFVLVIFEIPAHLR